MAELANRLEGKSEFSFASGQIKWISANKSLGLKSGERQRAGERERERKNERQRGGSKVLQGERMRNITRSLRSTFRELVKSKGQTINKADAVD